MDGTFPESAFQALWRAGDKMRSVVLMQAIRKAVEKLLIQRKVFRISLQGDLLLSALHTAFLYFLAAITDIQTCCKDSFVVLSSANSTLFTGRCRSISDTTSAVAVIPLPFAEGIQVQEHFMEMAV